MDSKINLGLYHARDRGIEDGTHRSSCYLSPLELALEVQQQHEVQVNFVTAKEMNTVGTSCVLGDTIWQPRSGRIGPHVHRFLAVPIPRYCSSQASM